MEPESSSESPQVRRGRLAPLLLAAFGLFTAGSLAIETAQTARQMPVADYVTAFESRVRPLRDRMPAKGPVRFLETPGEPAPPGRPSDFLHFLMIQYSIAPALLVVEAPADTAVWWGGYGSLPPGPAVLEGWEPQEDTGEPGLRLLARKRVSP